ncbi:DUF1064 domain-containing protein [Caproiciproducens sp. NJN-50]|uniref:DUF1064 domain-containing protein n=1 Tax=Caproiciproducens sp. NJN-50 TaxID=2507162 RepID=UPI000FFDFB20|nr:DUF1064 domain-containing protein [Caproiciproducens sp. NJN-50]QAT48565.1 DUF1064 domain-containing protein [Caproiciproducens sp. NJN-50]
MSTVFIPGFKFGNQRHSKYNAVKTTVDGITFDSKAEAKRYTELKLMLRTGQIKSFNRQPSFILSGGIRYRPDFIVWDGSRVWVEDVKGMETAAFKVKAAEFREKYPYFELRIVR